MKSEIWLSEGRRQELRKSARQNGLRWFKAPLSHFASHNLGVMPANAGIQYMLTDQ